MPGLARTRRTAKPGDRGEVAVVQSADRVGDDVGRAGPDAGDQCCPVVVACEAMQSNPFAPIPLGPNRDRVSDSPAWRSTGR